MRTLITVVLVFIRTLTFAQSYDAQTYAKPDSIAAIYFNHSLKHPDKLAQMLVEGLDSDEQKFRAIFRWIADNIEYDLQTYLHSERIKKKYGKNSRKFKTWQQRKSKYSYARTINKKKAVCSGYSTLLNVMCNAVAIPCKVISGYTKSSTGSIKSVELNHAWNAVLLNGKWYLCDVTWASGFLDPARMKMVRRFNPIFFLTDPTLFAAQHYPQDPSWLLLYPKPTLTDFMNAPRTTSAFVSNRINQYTPKNGLIKTKKDEAVEFSFTSNSGSIDRQVSFLVVQRKIKEYYEVAMEQDETLTYCYDHTFKKRGRFNVSIFINGYKTFEYLVYVK